MRKYSHPKSWPRYGLVILSQLKVAYWNLFELMRVSFRYYRSLSFFFTDLLLSVRYLFKSPFRLAKDIYGETPLTTLDKIAKECRLLSKDVVYDLGCGRGRALFWLRHFINCEVIGVDNQQIFIDRANAVKQRMQMNKMTFLSEDFTTLNFEKATVIYFYGTCYPDALIEKLIAKFRDLARGTKIISVSYPLTEFTTEPLFTLQKTFKGKYPWGTTEIFYQIKN